MVYGIKRFKTLYNDSAAGTGTVFPLDVRYDISPSRVLQGTVTAGDTIKIQGTTWDNRGPDKTGLASATWSDITSFTANFTYTLTGPWTYIRIVKTGTTGTAVVQGHI